MDLLCKLRRGKQFQLFILSPMDKLNEFYMTIFHKFRYTRVSWPFFIINVKTCNKVHVNMVYGLVHAIYRLFINLFFKVSITFSWIQNTSPLKFDLMPSSSLSIHWVSSKLRSWLLQETIEYIKIFQDHRSAVQNWCYEVVKDM